MKKFVFGMGVAMVAVFGTASCDHDKGPGTAEVKVVDSAGLAQEGVSVILYCTEVDCVVRREGLTNELGVYQTEFELPVVLRVRAVRYDSTITWVGLGPNKKKVVTLDSICGEGFIQIENDEISKETVTILECN